jgi:hypothetical protein
MNIKRKQTGEDAVGVTSVRVRCLALAWGDHDAVEIHKSNWVVPGMVPFLSPPVV